MRIVVARALTLTPPTESDRAGDHLVQRLRAAGHEVEHVRLPLSDRDWRTIPAQMVAARNFDVDDADRLITLDFPAYLLRHAHKVVWLFEHFEPGGEVSGAESPALSPSLGSPYRDLRSAADSEGLGEARLLFTTSTELGDRLRERHSLASTLLRPPPTDENLLTPHPVWDDAIARLLA